MVEDPFKRARRRQSFKFSQPFRFIGCPFDPAHVNVLHTIQSQLLKRRCGIGRVVHRGDDLLTGGNDRPRARHIALLYLMPLPTKQRRQPGEGRYTPRPLVRGQMGLEDDRRSRHIALQPVNRRRIFIEREDRAKAFGGDGAHKGRTIQPVWRFKHPTVGDAGRRGG